MQTQKWAKKIIFTWQSENPIIVKPETNDECSVV